ncbi:MAG: mycofactocin precursor peptide peptidase [Pseudonocardiales bacterium]|nr:mycofactocin precursor peptide peptidase [Pseudonocardiales bacterium]
MPLLADLTWPEIAERAASGALLAVPVGATEQHGPHLPLSTDTDVAVALCERLAAARVNVLIAPPVAYGSSGEHAGFAGTLSIGQAAVELLLIELGRSASDTFAHVIFVSAHGGNAEPVTRAVAQLRAESRDTRVFMPRWDGEAHAGRAETSMLLALARRVRMDVAVPGNTRPLEEIWPQLRSGGVRAVSRNGVLGDPTGASADEGHDLFNRLAAQLVDEVAAWRPAVTA